MKRVAAMGPTYNLQKLKTLTLPYAFLTVDSELSLSFLAISKFMWILMKKKFDLFSQIQNMEAVPEEPADV